jgi:hypothetical protein
MFTSSELRVAVNQLVDELAGRGVAARITILGGAAIALAYEPERQSTRDVDAVVHPEADVLAAAASVALRHGYPGDWLQNNVRIFLPHHGEIEETPIASSGEVRVSVGGPRLLLAMKLKASRGRGDLEDIRTLVHHLGITTVAEAEAIFEHYYRDDELSERGRQLLGAALTQ